MWVWIYGFLFNNCKYGYILVFVLECTKWHWKVINMFWLYCAVISEQSVLKVKVHKLRTWGKYLKYQVTTKFLIAVVFQSCFTSFGLKSWDSLDPVLICCTFSLILNLGSASKCSPPKESHSLVDFTQIISSPWLFWAPNKWV